MKKILITGATGFIGRALLGRLMLCPDVFLRLALRCSSSIIPANVESIVIGDFNNNIDWTDALRGIDVIVHLAARVHIMKETARDPLSEFSRVNVDSTLNLARQASVAGVQRFIYMSTIGVNGEATNGVPFRFDDTPKPFSPYTISKYHSELGLQKISKETGMEVVIIRPPLVIGPDAPGNFSKLVNLINSGMLLPFGSIHNKLSLVSIDNLVEIIYICLSHPGAVNQVFLASDGQDISTTELFKFLASALDRPSRLFPFPVILLKIIAYLLNKQNLSKRLFSSMQIDIAHTQKLLNWSPGISIYEGLRRAANFYKMKRLAPSSQN